MARYPPADRLIIRVALNRILILFRSFVPRIESPSSEGNHFSSVQLRVKKYFLSSSFSSLPSSFIMFVPVGKTPEIQNDIQIKIREPMVPVSIRLPWTWRTGLTSPAGSVLDEPDSDISCRTLPDKSARIGRGYRAVRQSFLSFSVCIVEGLISHCVLFVYVLFFSFSLV